MLYSRARTCMRRRHLHSPAPWNRLGYQLDNSNTARIRENLRNLCIHHRHRFHRAFVKAAKLYGSTSATTQLATSKHLLETSINLFGPIIHHITIDPNRNPRNRNPFSTAHRSTLYHRAVFSHYRHPTVFPASRRILHRLAAPNTTQLVYEHAANRFFREYQSNSSTVSHCDSIITFHKRELYQPFYGIYDPSRRNCLDMRRNRYSIF